jgi:hypothetical protein
MLNLENTGTPARDGAHRRPTRGSVRARARHGAADRWRAVVSVEATSLSSGVGSLAFHGFTNCSDPVGWVIGSRHRAGSSLSGNKTALLMWSRGRILSRAM